MIVALLLLLQSAPPAVIVDEAKVVRREKPPHDGKGMSTAYRITDAVPNRTMEFRRRVMHKGAIIGLHVLAHDEVYYVQSGEGIVTSDGKRTKLTTGMAAYLYKGADVGIEQAGEQDLALIISYPLPGK